MTPADEAAQPSAEWFEIKGRVFRFLGTHPGWALWRNEDDTEWICAQERDRGQELARATRVAAVVRDPKLFPSRSIPERHAYADVTARGWNRLLLGLFTYLGGPARLDDVVTVAGVLLHLPGAASVPTGAAVPLPEPSGEHVRYEEMDALVENTADAALQSRIAAHGEGCAFCARQVAAYQAAAEQVSAQLQKPVAS